MRILVVAAVLSVLAALFAGWTWWRAASDESLARGRDRDAVLAAAGPELVTLNTIDYRSAGADVDRWIAATTGQYGKDLSSDRQVQIERASSARTVSSASLVQAAVTEISADSARLLAVLDVRVSSGGGAASPRLNRLTVDVSRTPDGWKVSGVQAAGS
ncbi:Mce-associated membrane protein [Amycolatopsis pretoriensis]|uniref:Mce-associated membrane protein n=1 Tax=Amycolatopsis pretoriensis TaxID=218821 RepID=A0A1H5R6V7_9PSEU|nr:Mce-associated membrane protein [Amycolatopsis pretoriensis]